MIKRNISETVLRLAEAFPVVAILGPRQSGKTTLAKSLFKNYKYLSLEDLSLRDDAKKDPVGFLNLHKNKYGIIIDEFQHVPELLSYIQLAVDENRTPGYFILTGSQNFLMNKAISQTLAGRIAITTLLPLSTGELKNADLLPEAITDLAYKGEYPELYTNDKLLPYDMYANYTKTYIERDVRDLQNVHDLSKFIKFMTAKAWLSILETSYIVFMLQPYSAQFTRRLIKTPKLFFYDTGLASYLLGIENIEDLKISRYRGNLIESLLMSQIVKLYFNSGKNPNIYFLRDKTGHEIDCLVEKANKLIPIEIKSNMTPNRSFFDEINFWRSVDQIGNKKISEGFVIYPGNQTEKRTYGTFLSWRDFTTFDDI